MQSAAANSHVRNTSCSPDGVDIPDMIQAVYAHEGFGRNGGTGHESLAQAEASQPGNDPYLFAEPLVADDSLTLRQAVVQGVTAISTRIFNAAADGPNGPAGNIAIVNGTWYTWQTSPSNPVPTWYRTTFSMNK